MINIKMTEEEIQQAIKFLEKERQAGVTTISIQGGKYLIAELIEETKLRHQKTISLLEILKGERFQEFMMSL